MIGRATENLDKIWIKNNNKVSENVLYIFKKPFINFWVAKGVNLYF